MNKTTEAVKQEPVAWHHPECEGECIACLIERCVKDSYGKQGVDYMLRHMNAAPVQPVEQEPVAIAWQQGYDQGVSDERTSEASIGIAGFNAKVNPARENPYKKQPVKQEPVEYTFNVEVEGKANAVFDTANEAVRFSMHHVYLSSGKTQEAIDTLNQGQVFQYGYEFAGVNIVPVAKRKIAAPVDAKANAKEKYDKFMAECEEPDPIERLRFFCSLAMGGKNWIDVEEFFDDLIAERKAIRAEALEYAAQICDEIAHNDSGFVAEDCAAAIRGLK